MLANQLRRAANCGNMNFSLKAFLRPAFVLATSNLAQCFTPIFAPWCRSFLKESQPSQPRRRPSSLLRGDDNDYDGFLADEDSDNNPEGATDDGEEGGSQDAPILAEVGYPDKSPWPIHFTKDEFDSVNERLTNSQPADVIAANGRKLFQWISTSCDLIEDGDGETSYVMVVDAIERFPMEEVTIVVQEPRMEEFQTYTSDALLDGPDFLRSLLKAMYANNRWNGYDLSVLMESGDLFIIDLKRHLTLQDALNDLDDKKMIGPLRWIRSTSPDKIAATFKKDRFTQAVIDYTYVNNSRAKAVKKFLDGTHRTIQQVNGIAGVDYAPIRLNYVKRESSEGDPLVSIICGDLVALDKRPCIVVAGESGSGKTTFAVENFIAQRCAVFYATIQQDDYDNTYEPPEHTFRICRDALQKVIDAVDILSDENFTSGRQKQSCLDLLFDVKEYYNMSRSAWAWQVAERAWIRVMRETAESQTDLKAWWDGKLEQRDRPTSLAFILDEVTNLDLAEGLVDVRRSLMFRLEQNLTQNRVSFVLCGTGLDDMSPLYRSSVVIVRGPDFDELQKEGRLTSVEKVAIDQGVYGRVLSTNSRMFFQGVFPFLRQIDPNENNTPEALVDVTSSSITMRYAVSSYMASDAIGKLSQKEKKKLLEDAYLYHLLRAVLDVKMHNNPLLNYLNEILWLLNHKQVRILLSLMLEREKIPDWHTAFAQKLLGSTATAEISSSNRSPDIFAAGLVADKASVALKYLACRGKVNPLAKSNGAGFETMVGASLARMMEALGYQVHRVTLEQAWPHEATKDINYTRSDIAVLKAKLKKYGKKATKKSRGGKRDSDGNTKVEATSWTRFLLSEELHCIIFRQGVQDAQGPDLFMLYQDGESGDMLLDSIKATHRAVPARPELLTWFESVGVTETDTSPKSGRAGWSYAGLEAFRCYVQDQTGKSVELGRRIIASSAPAANWQDLSSALPWASEQQPDFATAKIWPREMFEPMISVLEDNTAP